MAAANTATGPYIVIPAQQNLPTIVPAAQAPGQPPRFHQEFLTGQPKALGATQIMVALLYISLGSVLLVTIESFLSIGTYSGISYWGAVCYIISGALSVAAENTQSISLVRGALALNIISSVVSLTAIGLYSYDTAIYIHNYNPGCTGLCNLYNQEVFLLRELALGFLILASLVEFCVSVSVSVYGCRSLDKNSAVPQVFMISNDYQYPPMGHTSSGNTNQYPAHPNFQGNENYRTPTGTSAVPDVNAVSPQQYPPPRSNLYPPIYPPQS